MNAKAFILIITACISYSALAQRSNWAIPDFASVQYAGSIGYISAGAGYEVFNNKARFSTHFGIAPGYRSGQLKIVSMKFFYKPVRLTVWNRVRMNPIDIGIMASYHYGNKLDIQWQEGVFPKGYYWWNPPLRAHLAIENSVTYEFKKGHKFTSATGFIEFNTNELHFVNFIRNMETVRLWDIVKIGTGVRLTF